MQSILCVFYSFSPQNIVARQHFSSFIVDDFALYRCHIFFTLTAFVCAFICLKSSGHSMQHDYWPITINSCSVCHITFSLKLQIIFITHEMSVKCLILCVHQNLSSIFIIAKRIFVLFYFYSNNSLFSFLLPKDEQKKNNFIALNLPHECFSLSL